VKKLVHYMGLLLAVSLLPGALEAAVPTTSFTISSLYGLNFGTVTVSDVTAPGNLQPYTCDFSKSSQCVIPNVTRGDALHLALKANIGFVVSGSTGNCAGFPSDTTQFKVPASGEMACGIFGGYPLTIQAAGAAKLGISDMAVGGRAIPVGPSCQPGGEASCQVAVAPGTLTLTVGLQQGQVLAGGSRLCSKATAAPFEITVPPTGPYVCVINTGVPSTPASGWWWTQQTPDSGIRYALQFSADLSSLYGIAATFRDDGSPVWYVINANNTADANSKDAANGPGPASWTFAGSASEYAGGGGLTGGPESNSAGLQTIFADVEFTFPAVGPATLSWSVRDGGPRVVKSLTRFPIGSTVQAAPAYAPATGFYAPAQGAGVSYFVEMQGSAAGNPHAYIGAFSYGKDGRATWSVSDTLGTYLVTPYPAAMEQAGWRARTNLLNPSGGAPIEAAKPKQPKQTVGEPILAQFIPSKGVGGQASNAANAPASSTVQLANAAPAALVPLAQAQAAPSAVALHFVNMGKTYTNPYVTFFGNSSATSYFWYMSKGQVVKLKSFTSYPISALPGGSLNASVMGIGGNLYISDKPLTARNGTKCAPISPANNAAPSPVSPTDCNLNTRWQFIELGGNYDITYINVFSIPLGISQSTSGSLGITTLPKILLLEKNLAQLTKPAGAALWPKSSQGDANFIRAISPANAASTNALLAQYPSFQSYFTDAFKGPNGAASPTININNFYTGVQGGVPSPTSICRTLAFQGQNYSTSSITYKDNALIINGTAGRVGAFTIRAQTLILPLRFGCTAASTIGRCFSPQTTAAQLTGEFYTNVISYSVVNRNCTAGLVENNGANDVFSVVVRDMLVGFVSGFVDSTVASPIAGKNYGAMTSQQWSTRATKIFAKVQPSKPFYNTWGAAFFDLFANEVYGFQYSDYFTQAAEQALKNPQLTIKPRIPVQISIMDNRP
jgi:Beta-1,3-glucanase